MVADRIELDVGPWTFAKGERPIKIYSDDFEHDVSITVTGDFANQEQRDSYAAALVSRLNEGPLLLPPLQEPDL